jgi:hypothetical protein
MKKMVFVGIVLLTVGGCTPFGGTFKFDGPSGATYRTFAKTFSQCYSDLREGTTKISCGAMKACMAGEGYNQDPQGRFDGKSIAVGCKR